MDRGGGAIWTDGLVECSFAGGFTIDFWTTVASFFGLCGDETEGPRRRSGGSGGGSAVGGIGGSVNARASGIPSITTRCFTPGEGFSATSFRRWTRILARTTVRCCLRVGGCGASFSRSGATSGRTSASCSSVCIFSTSRRRRATVTIRCLSCCDGGSGFAGASLIPTGTRARGCDGNAGACSATTRGWTTGGELARRRALGGTRSSSSWIRPGSECCSAVRVTGRNRTT